MQRENIIKRYFQAWINKDITIIKQTFADNIIYSECYGPEYHGLQQILQWFDEWNKIGKVLIWTIKRFIHQDNITVVEWHFKCDYKNEIGEFDGITVIEFDANMKIIKLSEFQSKSEHYYPYEKY